jgi:hypothetical protein
VTDVVEPDEDQAAESQAAEETIIEPERRPVMVEFIGSEPHGTTLHRKRVISRADAKAGWGLTISKDLEWSRQNGFKMVLEGNEHALTPEVLAHLAEDPKFKIHYETVRD